MIHEIILCFWFFRTWLRLLYRNWCGFCWWVKSIKQRIMISLFLRLSRRHGSRSKIHIQESFCSFPLFFQMINNRCFNKKWFWISKQFRSWLFLFYNYNRLSLFIFLLFRHWSNVGRDRLCQFLLFSLPKLWLLLFTLFTRAFFIWTAHNLLLLFLIFLRLWSFVFFRIFLFLSCIFVHESLLLVL